MKERGDCEGGRAPNIDQGASVAMRQRGACAKVERKARTRRDFSAFSLVVPSQTGNSRSRTALALLHRLSSTQPRAVSVSLRAYACALVRRFSIFAFTPSPACRNPHTHNAISVKTLLAVPSPAPSLRHRWFGALFSVHCESSGRGCDTRRTCAIAFGNG